MFSEPFSAPRGQEWNRPRIGFFQGCDFPEYGEVKSTRREVRLGAEEGFCDSPRDFSKVRKGRPLGRKWHRKGTGTGDSRL